MSPPITPKQNQGSLSLVTIAGDDRMERTFVWFQAIQMIFIQGEQGAAVLDGEPQFLGS